MNKTFRAPIHSLAVALLAMAVIVLAIKEPKDCVNNSNEVAVPSAPSAPTSTGTSPAGQRELRKF